mgnify:CR=1 FL=1
MGGYARKLTLLLLCVLGQIPLLTDSPSASTAHLGRVAMPANLPYYYSVEQHGIDVAGMLVK